MDGDPKNVFTENNKDPELVAALVTNYEKIDARSRDKSDILRQVVAKMKNTIELGQLNDKQLKTWCRHIYERHILGSLCSGILTEEKMVEIQN